MIRWNKHPVPSAMIMLVFALLLLVQNVAARQESQQQLESPRLDTALGPSSTVFSYQGQLLEASGEPVNGSVNMVFSLFYLPEGGTAFWNEAHTGASAVSVSDGYFDVLLGSLTSLNPADLTGDLYLDITVNGEQMAPRELLASVPYAIAAQKADGDFIVSGNIGVGTTQPQKPLEVVGTVAAAQTAGVGPAVGLLADSYGGSLWTNAAYDRSQPGSGWARTITMQGGSVGIGTSNPAYKLEVAGSISLMDNSLLNVRSLRLKDWDDDSGGSDDKYRLLARDGAWMFYNGGVAVGGFANGTWSDLSDGTLIVKNKVGIGTANPSAETAVQINTPAVPLTFQETGQTGAGSLWRMPLDGKQLRFDVSQNGTDFSAYNVALVMYSNGSIGCGALTEANLQTPDERAAGGTNRFEEGDVLCWGIDHLEKCVVANDRLVQAVADKGGRPIVIGAELVKVLGPVQRGDILVASDVAGYAMVNNDPAPGSVIAQALEDFDEEMGIIKAMIRKF